MSARAGFVILRGTPRVVNSFLSRSKLLGQDSAKVQTPEQIMRHAEHSARDKSLDRLRGLLQPLVARIWPLAPPALWPPPRPGAPPGPWLAPCGATAEAPRQSPALAEQPLQSRAQSAAPRGPTRGSWPGPGCKTTSPSGETLGELHVCFSF